MEIRNITTNDVVYHCLGEDINTGILACGYMSKGAHKSQMDFQIGYYSCFLLLRGSGSYSDKVHGEIPLSPGCIVQRMPNMTHSSKVDPDGKWLEFFVSFGRPVFNYLHTLGLIQQTQPVFSIQNSETMIHSFNRLLTQMRHGGISLYPQLLLEAQKIVLSLYQRTTPHKNNLHHDAVAKGCSILRSSSGRFLGLEDVAAQVGMEYDKFRKAFAKITGKSPAAYRTDENMKQACMMLHTGLPIKEIAFELGYSDVYSFTKQFSKTIGISPGRYRLATNGNGDNLQ